MNIFAHRDQLCADVSSKVSFNVQSLIGNNSRLYYRTVLLDEARNTLYVGAMDKLFKGK